MKVLKFYATWCGPCRAFSPVLAEFAEENQLDLIEVDIDQEPYVAERFGVQSVPTTVFLRDDREVARVIGVKPKPELKKALTN